MSAYENCFSENNIWYCLRNNVYIVGNNESGNGNIQNAFVSDSDQSHVTIPVSAGGFRIREIGSFAFCCCFTLTHVNIRARIYQINSHAFQECKNLEEIRIPNTCEYIGSWGIQTYDQSIGNNNPNPYKSLSVIFEPKSRIKSIDSHGISYRTNVNIFFCNKVDLYLDEEAFIKAINIDVYSPVSFVFNGVQTLNHPYPSQCFAGLTCKTQRKSSQLTLFLTFMICK